MTKRLIGGALALALAAVLAVPAAATPPGQNGLLQWSQETRSGVNLWVSNPDGSAARRVFARAGRFDLLAGFSPTDPNLLFFSRGREAPFTVDILSGNLASGEVDTVIGARSDDVSPTFSPDGSRIAYFSVRKPRRIREDRPGPPERIKIANADGSGARFITARGALRSFDPEWSPDGTRIVYAESRPVGDSIQFRIVIINADGSGRRVLTRFGGVDEINPNFMPDGQAIVFERLRERGRRSDIAAMNPDGSGVRTILSTRAWETNPIPSPDGTRIAFTSDRAKRGRKRLNRRFEVYTMAVDGTDIQRVTNNRQPDFFPDWQRLP